MTDRPILFSSPMVRALLAGTKTQTRRTLNPQPNVLNGGLPLNDGRGSYSTESGWKRYRIVAGDRLYVRESWNWTHIADLAPGETLGRTVDECCEANDGFACPCGDGIVYAATNAHEHPVHGKARWKPSLHMPRWASRLTLHVTDVRVQRLQDISEEDAIAEGVERLHHGFYPYGIATFMTVFVDGKEVPAQCCTSARDSYRMLWESINGRGAWDTNPWVAAYTFEVERANIANARAA